MICKFVQVWNKVWGRESQGSGYDEASSFFSAHCMCNIGTNEVSHFA